MNPKPTPDEPFEPDAPTFAELRDALIRVAGQARLRYSMTMPRTVGSQRIVVAFDDILVTEEDVRRYSPPKRAGE